MKKQLMRSGRDKKIAGVCAGVANYFDMDPRSWDCSLYHFMDYCTSSK